ncbi:MAG: CbtA family protein [Pseudomonadota bacterium]
MTRDLLWRGLLAGVVAALCAWLFARLLAEPQIDLAIAFEAAHAAHDDHAPELVSRATQKGAGLLTALVLFGASMGGLFAITFAALVGRVGRVGPRELALLMAALAFVAFALVPSLKYPPTPPAVGQHETIVLRTAAHFQMLGLSGLALAAALFLRTRLVLRPLDAWMLAALAYLALIASAQAVLPSVDEVPADFPAGLLWRYRVASVGTQAVLWGALGLGFGALAERRLRREVRGPALA